jgi:hypothetical protein
MSTKTESVALKEARDRGTAHYRERRDRLTPILKWYVPIIVSILFVIWRFCHFIT